jgi:hypothetical protein
MLSKIFKQMKKEVTWGQLIGIILTVIITFGGWIISVEVRLKSHEIQIEQIVELIKEQSIMVKDINKNVNEIHDVVIKHEVIIDQNKLYSKSNYQYGKENDPNRKNFTIF